MKMKIKMVNFKTLFIVASFLLPIFSMSAKVYYLDVSCVHNITGDSQIYDVDGTHTCNDNWTNCAKIFSTLPQLTKL